MKNYRNLNGIASIMEFFCLQERLVLQIYIVNDNARVDQRKMLTQPVKNILMCLAAILFVVCSGCAVTQKRPTVQDFRRAADMGGVSTLIAWLRTADQPDNPSGINDYCSGMENRHVERYLACVHLVLIGEPAVPALIEVLKNDTNVRTRAYAALALGRIGPRAKKAVPSLIDLFPLRLKERKTTSSAPGITPPKVDDYQIIERWIKSAEELGVEYETLPEVQKLRSLYGKHITITGVKVYMAVYKWSRQQCIDRTHVVENTIISYSIDVVPFALNKITREDFGSDKEKWEQWWEKKCRVVQSSQ
jgi:hypothetical protein